MIDWTAPDLLNREPNAEDFDRRRKGSRLTRLRNSGPISLFTQKKTMKTIVTSWTPLLRAFYVVLLFIAALWTMPGTARAQLVIGGFDASRGGFESLMSVEGSTLATDITTEIPGTTFSFSNTLTPSFLAGVNAVILGVATTETSAITPLTSSEQTALHNFVLNGGTALIFSDNDSFDPNAPVVNASVLTPFGLTATGTLPPPANPSILNPSGPLTGPFKPVTDFTTLDAGFFNGTGTGTVLAQFAPGEAAIDYFARGTLGPHSGTAVFFSDSNTLPGDTLTTSNLNLVLNALAVPEPSPWSMIAVGGVALVGIMLRKKHRIA